MSEDDGNPEDRGPPDEMRVVYRYARADALRDGVLVDLTEWARELGFVVHVACTAGVWDGCVVPDESLRRAGQSERGRAHDLLFALRAAVGVVAGGPMADRLEFAVLFLMPPRQHAEVRLVAVCGLGDAGEPVLTVMLPGED